MGVSVAICTTQSPELAPLKKGPKKGLKSKKVLKTKGKSPKTTPYSSSKGGKKSGWKVLKARTFKKKTRVGKKKLRAIVKFKKGAKKTTKKKKAAKGKARPVDEPVAQPEIEEETASLNGESDSSDSEFETNDLTSDNTSSHSSDPRPPSLPPPHRLPKPRLVTTRRGQSLNLLSIHCSALQTQTLSLRKSWILWI